MTQVYLIHLDRPMGGNHPKGKAQHYLGYTQLETVEERFKRHLSGRGARMLRIAKQRGIGFRIVRVWEGGHKLELELKRHHHSADFCPICNVAVADQLYHSSNESDKADIPF